MKIAILIPCFLPKWFGGTEVATHHLAGHLAKRGHEVHVITPLDEGLPEESCENGFYIHRLPKIATGFPGGFTFWIDIVRAIRKIRPDIVHAQSLNSGIPALLSNKLLKIPYVVYGRGLDVYLPEWYVKLTAKAVLKNAGVAIALTKDMKKVMQAMYSRDVVVVPNGIDLGEDSLRQREAENYSEKVLFVGRLSSVKGIQYLLGAMRIVHGELPGVKLILVGDGEERKYLEHLTDHLGIRECVEFVGAVPHERVQDYMHHADVLALTSLSEGFPVTILEAMASGLPVVATCVGGVPEIIENNVNGYLVETENQKVIAEALLKLLRDGQLRKHISGNNRKKAEKYRWDMVAATLEEIYQNTLY
jgi:glycosyltransferase involved in cell wall biosynthesis